MTGKGRSAEQRVYDAFTSDGYTCWLSRGSHGAADMVAVKPGYLPGNSTVALVQVKGGHEQISRLEWEALRLIANQIGAQAVVAEVRRTNTFPPRTHITLTKITGPAHTARRTGWPSEPFILDQLEAAVAAHPAGKARP